MTDVRTPPGDEAGEDARPDEDDGDPTTCEPAPPDDPDLPEPRRVKGWVLACTAGLQLVGQFDKGTLEPVYEFKPQIAQTPQGLQVSHICLPLMMLASWRKVRLPVGTIVQPVDELSKADRDQIFRAVAQGEEMAKGLRMAQAGVVAPAAGALAAMRAGMKLGGPGGRRG